VLVQDYENLELILIDDKSRDKTPDIIRKIAAGDARVRPIFMSVNGGAAAARNAGLDYARGKYIMFCDADDYWLRGMASRMVGEIRRWRVDLAQCGVKLLNAGAGVRRVEKEQMAFVSHGNGVVDLDEKAYANINSVLYNKIFRRRLIEKYRLRMPLQTTSEDFAFSLAYATLCRRVSFVKAAIMAHLFQRGSLMDLREAPDKLLDILSAVSFALEFARRWRLRRWERYLDSLFTHYALLNLEGFEKELDRKTRGRKKAKRKPRKRFTPPHG